MENFRVEREVVEGLVEEAFDLGTRIISVEPIGTWSVARVRVELPGTGEDSLIVKALRNLPSGVRAEQSRILNEQAALEFVGEIDQSLAPRLLAANAAHGIVAIEDLSPLVPLNEALLSGHRTAVEGLKLFSHSLTRLHGATVGRRDDYDRKRAKLGVMSSHDAARLVLGAWDWTLPNLGEHGLVATPAATSEMRDAEVLLCAPGPLTAFSNGDPGLHNFLTDGNQSRIIDWEDACFRHVALDISCIWVPNSVWMTLADPVELGVDRVYRDAIADAIPQAGTSDFGEALAGACIARAADRLQRFQLLDDRPPGHESRAQMVFTLEAAARSAGYLKSFPALAAWANDAAAFLRARWPDADCEFPDAYTTRAAWTEGR